MVSLCYHVVISNHSKDRFRQLSFPALFEILAATDREAYRSILSMGEVKDNILCFKMLREASIDWDNDKGRCCIVIGISKAHSKGDTSIIYARKIDGDEAGEGEPFRLAKKDFRFIWANEEVTAERIRFGSVVKYVQVGDEYLFQRNTKRRQVNISWHSSDQDSSLITADHDNACILKT